jgi:type IV secretory pathway component VirB8
VVLNKSNQNGQLSDFDLEKLLQKKLHPINPRPEFIDRVKSRIVNDPYILLERSRDYSLYYVLIMGLIAGLAAILITRLLRK